jgi:amino acid transporter
MVQSLGEIVTWLPISGGLTVYAHRYADPAMGFAMGWKLVFTAALMYVESNVVLVMH